MKKRRIIAALSVLMFMLVGCSAEAAARFNRSMQRFSENMQNLNLANNSYTSSNMVYNSGYTNAYATARPVMNSSGYAEPMKTSTRISSNGYVPQANNAGYVSYTPVSNDRNYGSSHNYTTTRTCSYCGGSRIVTNRYTGAMQTCGVCSGAGGFSETTTLRNTSRYTEEICTVCNGQKRLYGQVCSACRGSGKITRWR